MNVVTRFTISRSFVSFLLSGRAEVVVCFSGDGGGGGGGRVT